MKDFIADTVTWLAASSHLVLTAAPDPKRTQVIKQHRQQQHQRHQQQSSNTSIFFKFLVEISCLVHLCLALKIHVSEDCYRLLKEIGGYTFLKRGEVYLKVRAVHISSEMASFGYFQLLSRVWFCERLNCACSLFFPVTWKS